ncbi:cyclophane-forming radical SAM peptide maturase AmcB [Streptomyces sp. NPDC051105]|uniref:cyclophane-forming radical SAM peptide maturase AmcB n=1 Tax=Streptomyces sp. NPDC051105 TaxID=3154843 RepID=UPI0034425962
MPELASTASVVFLQPVTLCNLDCSYCYLPERALRRRMSVDVADAVARAVSVWSDVHPVNVVWHGGEPLALGLPGFVELLGRFRAGAQRVSHTVQTNGTLIDDAWCEVFVRHRVAVTVSLDGPGRFNRDRVTRAGRGSLDRTLRGIAALRRHHLPFAAIAVVQDPDPEQAEELYDWFAALGCRSLGINIVERKGTHVRVSADDERVTAFWTALALRWRRDRRLPIREFDHALRYVAAELGGRARERALAPHDPLPMIGWDGDVTLFGPDLSGFSSSRLGTFDVGNVADADLTELVARAAQSGWVREVLDGTEACRSTCDHYAYCLGGQPANKYFETGRFDVTETTHCRNSKKRLMKGLMRGVPEPRAT